MRQLSYPSKITKENGQNTIKFVVNGLVAEGNRLVFDTKFFEAGKWVLFEMLTNGSPNYVVAKIVASFGSYLKLRTRRGKDVKGYELITLTVSDYIKDTVFGNVNHATKEKLEAKFGKTSTECYTAVSEDTTIVRDFKAKYVLYAHSGRSVSLLSDTPKVVFSNKLNNSSFIFFDKKGEAYTLNNITDDRSAIEIVPIKYVHSENNRKSFTTDYDNIIEFTYRDVYVRAADFHDKISKVVKFDQATMTFEDIDFSEYFTTIPQYDGKLVHNIHYPVAFVDNTSEYVEEIIYECGHNMHNALRNLRKYNKVYSLYTSKAEVTLEQLLNSI